MRQLDVRVLPPSKKHGTIHECLEQLASGETLRIVNDHDPRPLRYELDDAYPGAFVWTYLDCGPELWRVDISKKQELRRHSQVDVLADCHALRVGFVRGNRRALGVRRGWDDHDFRVFAHAEKRRRRTHLSRRAMYDHCDHAGSRVSRHSEG